MKACKQQEVHVGLAVMEVSLQRCMLTACTGEGCQPYLSWNLLHAIVTQRNLYRKGIIGQRDMATPVT